MPSDPAATSSFPSMGPPPLVGFAHTIAWGSLKAPNFRDGPVGLMMEGESGGREGRGTGRVPGV